MTESLVISLEEFAEGEYADDAPHNLYIVWRCKQALYIGVSRDDIWNRWFSRGGQSHILLYPRWYGISYIGKVIASNLPESANWKIELRYTPGNLKETERELILQLHPLFNSMYLPKLTLEQRALSSSLTEKLLRERLSNPGESYIDYDEE